MDELIVQHLYNNKKVDLQGIGSFKIADDAILPTSPDDNVEFQKEGISFEYNPKAKEDESLVDFIVDQTKKIKPLASADLDSYLVLGRQFLNIGKPFNLEGAGTLNKAQDGSYEFKAGQFIAPKLETTYTHLREKEQPKINYEVAPKNPFNWKKIFVTIGSLLGIAAIAGLGYYLYKSDVFKSTPKKETVTTQAKVIIKEDSTRIKDSLKALENGGYLAKDYNFKIIMRESADLDAIKGRVKTLSTNGSNVELAANKDSSLWRVILNETKFTLADSTKILDSVKKYFGDKNAKMLF